MLRLSICQQEDQRNVIIYECFHNIHVNKMVPPQIFSYIYLGEFTVIYDRLFNDVYTDEW